MELKRNIQACATKGTGWNTIGNYKKAGNASQWGEMMEGLTGAPAGGDRNSS